MFEITVEHTFAASHAIRLPDGSLEPLHGHNWQLTVTLQRDGLDAIETVFDFHALEHIVEQIAQPFHNRHLNDLPPFDTGSISPTAERVAWWVGTQVGQRLPDEVTLQCVRVSEAPRCWAAWRP
ncbi:MAG: 6-carboxytetrahydropterin synthase [Phycisphaeraceae bacterium]